jgi:hypothetical protein
MQRAGLPAVLLEASPAGIGRGQLLPGALAEAAVRPTQKADVVERAEAFERLEAEENVSVRPTP